MKVINARLRVLPMESDREVVVHGSASVSQSTMMYDIRAILGKIKKQTTPTSQKCKRLALGGLFSPPLVDVSTI